MHEPRRSGPPSAKLRRELIAHRYAPLQEIARGGMGVVYRVLDAVSGEERALKRALSGDPLRRDVYRGAFEREYQVLAAIDHPRVVRAFEYGVDEQGPYYTMDLVRGEDLKQPVRREWREVCSLTRDVASALSLLHARKLVYRDLNPGNVKVTSTGHCTLLDFGALGDFGRQELVIGAPMCIPPEAVIGGVLDQRADLYALGTLMYWMLTGRKAFPASDVRALPAAWKEAPAPLSAWGVNVPEQLETLIASMLKIEPLARPGSAAEVIARVDAIARLPAVPADERRRVALSFLTVPPFVGRRAERELLGPLLDATLSGKGSAVRLVGSPGTGRTRILYEIAALATLRGATTLRVDATSQRGRGGTARALALRLLDLLPDLANDCGAGYMEVLRVLESLRSGAAPEIAETELSRWFIAVSRRRPLLIQVDNAEACDDASVGLLIALLKSSPHERMMLLLGERAGAASSGAQRLLQQRCRTVVLRNLDAEDTRTLVRTLFDETPHVDRLAHWLHHHTDGNPSRALSLISRLVDQGVIHYESGYWVVPARVSEEVEARPPVEDELVREFGALGTAAARLARTLSLLHADASAPLCRVLARGDGPDTSSDPTPAPLRELMERGFIVPSGDSYRFRSAEVQSWVAASSSEAAQVRDHARLGAAIAELSAPDDVADRLRAGWHLMHGHDALQGARFVAATLSQTFMLQQLESKGYPFGRVSEYALLIYKRHRCTPYEQLPLLVAATHAVFHGSYGLYERYADLALDAADDLSGLRLARRLTAWIGRPIALLAAVLVAALRFYLVPRRERGYSFVSLLRHMGNCVGLCTGIAALGLEPERCERIAAIVDPFAVLPKFSTPKGLHSLCDGFTQIGRERPVDSVAIFSALIAQFGDRRSFPILAESERALGLASATYARAGISVFRADGALALADADALERCGLPAYARVAPYLRFLYYALRGESLASTPHREQLERQAASTGAAWQAELWMAAALLPLGLAVGDLMAVTHLKHRLDELARDAPSMRFYSRLAAAALHLAKDDLSEQELALVVSEIERGGPRGFIGWSVLVAMAARSLNRWGRHAEARSMCERALAVMSDADRDYVGLFLYVDIEVAHADAGLGRIDGANARIDALLTRFEGTGHPLALGLLNEARAEIAVRAGDEAAYRRGLANVERLFRPTGTAVLIGKVERLAALGLPATPYRAPDTLAREDHQSDSATDAVGDPTEVEGRK